jgi:hypothetical protein
MAQYCSAAFIGALLMFAGLLFAQRADRALSLE